MVRETRHLWVGNLPENVREEKIIEHFKRYGRVESVKILPKRGSEGGVAAFVDFVDIKSAQKAHNSSNKMGDRDLRTDYNEPGTIPSAARGLDDTVSIGSRSREVSGFRGSGGGPAYGPPSSIHGREGRYERRLDGASDTRERAYEHSAYGHHERGTGGFERTRHYEQDYYRDPRERTLQHGLYYGSRSRSPSRFDDPRYETRTREQFTLPSVVHRDIYRDDVTREARGRRQDRNYQHSRSRSPHSSHSRNQSPQRLASQASRPPRSPSGSGSRSRSSSSDSVSSSSSSSSDSSDSSSSSSDESPARSVQSTAVPAPPAQPPPALDKDEPRKSFGIKVQNLPVRSTDTSLKDGLFHEFKKYGKVTSVQIHGASEERYGLVFFRQQEDQEKALNASKGKLFFGMQIEVTAWTGPETESENEFRPLDEKIDEFHPKATRTLFIGNLEKTTTYTDLQNIFQRFGEIVDIDIKKVNGVPQYAFLQYCDIASVCKAIKKMDGEYLGNNRLKLGFGKSMPTNCVWLDGLSASITEQYLTRHFCRYGPVVKVVFDRLKGMALVLYNEIEYAQVAVKETKGRKIGGNKIKVDFANRESQLAFYNSMETSGQDIRDFFEILTERREERRGPYHEYTADRTYFEAVRAPGTYPDDPRREYPTRSREFYPEWDPYQGDFYDPRYYEDPREYREFRDPYEQDIREYSYRQRERERERERFETDRDRDHERRTVERSQSPAHSRRTQSPSGSPARSERLQSDSERRIYSRSSDRSGSCSSVSPPRYEKSDKSRADRYSKNDKLDKDRIFDADRTDKDKRLKKDKVDKEKVDKVKARKSKAPSTSSPSSETEQEHDKEQSPEVLKGKSKQLSKEKDKEGISKNRLDLMPCIILTRVREGKAVDPGLDKRLKTEGDIVKSVPVEQKTQSSRTDVNKSDLLKQEATRLKVPKDKVLASHVEIVDREAKLKPKKHFKQEQNSDGANAIDLDKLEARKRRFADVNLRTDRQKVEVKRSSQDDEEVRLCLKRQHETPSAREVTLIKEELERKPLRKEILKREYKKMKQERLVTVTSPKDGHEAIGLSVGIGLRLNSDLHGRVGEPSDEPLDFQDISSKISVIKPQPRSNFQLSEEHGSDRDPIKDECRKNSMSVLEEMVDYKYPQEKFQPFDIEEKLGIDIDHTQSYRKQMELSRRLKQQQEMETVKSEKFGSPKKEIEEYEKRSLVHEVGKPPQDVTDDSPPSKRKKFDVFDFEVSTKRERNYRSSRQVSEDFEKNISSPGFRLNYHDPPLVSDDNASDSPRLMALRDTKESPKLEERGVSCSGMIAREDSFKFNIYESGRREQMADFGKMKLSSLSSEDETTKWDFHLKQEPSRSDVGFSSNLIKKSNFHRRSLRELEPGEVPSDSDDDSDTKSHSPKPSALLENSKLSLFLRDREDRLPSSLERHKFYSFALDKTITPDTKALLERAKSLSSSREENWSFLDWDSRFASFRNNKDKEKVESAPRPIPSWYMKKKKIRTDSEGKIDDKKDDQKEEEQEKQELFASRFLHSSIFEQDSKRLQHLEKKDDDLDFLSGRLYGRQLSSDGLNSTTELVQEPVVLFRSRFIELTRMQQKEKEKDQKPKEPEKQEVPRETRPKTPERVSEVKEPEISAVNITGPSLPSLLQTEPQEPLPVQTEKAIESQTAEVKEQTPVESPRAAEESKPKSESSLAFSTVPVDSVELVIEKEQKNDNASVPVVEEELAPVEHPSYLDTKPPTPGASFSHEDISMDTESAELNIVSSPVTVKNTEEADEPKEESTLSVLVSSPNTDQKAEETTEKQAVISDNDMEIELPVTPKDRKLSRSKRTKATLQTSVANIVEKPATRKSERIDREKRKRSSSPRVEVPKIVESKAETDKVSRTPAKSPTSIVELESPEPNVTSRTRRKVKSVYATIRDDDPLPAKGSTESVRSTRKRAEKDAQETSNVTTPRRGRPPKSQRKPGEDVSPTKINHVKQETEEIDTKEIIESPKPVEGWRSPRSQKLLQRHSSPPSASNQGRRGKNELKTTDISLVPPENPHEEANQETVATEDASKVNKDNAEAENENCNIKEADTKISECVSAEVTEKKSASEKVTKVKSGRSRNTKTANENKPVCLKSLEIRLSVDEVKEALQQEEPEPADPPLTEDKSLKNDNLNMAPKSATEDTCSEVVSSESLTDPAHSSEDTQLAKQIELEQAVENIAKLTEASTLSTYKEHRDESEIGQNDEGDKPGHQASETELAAAIGSIITDEISVEADTFPPPQPYSGQSDPDVAGDTVNLPSVSQESMEPETNQAVTNILGTHTHVDASDHSVTAPAPPVVEAESKNSEDALKETSTTVQEAEPVRVSLEVTRKKGRPKTPRSKRCRRGSSNRKSETTVECSVNENDATQAEDLKQTEATNAAETISEEPANDEGRNKGEDALKTVVETKPNSDFNVIAEVSPSETIHNSEPSSEVCTSRDFQISTAAENKTQPLLHLHHTIESNPTTPPSAPKLALPLVSTSGVPPVSAGTVPQQSNVTIIPEWKTRHEDARPHSTPPPAHPPDTKASDIDSNSSTLRRMLLESKYVSAKNVPTTHVTAAVSEPVISSCLEETSNPIVEEVKPALEEKAVIPAIGATTIPPPIDVSAFTEKQKFSGTVITTKATSVISRMSSGFDLDETPRITLGKPSSQPMTSSMSSVKHKHRININDNRYHAGSMAVLEDTRPVEMSPLTTGSSPGLRVNTSEGVVVLSYSGQKTEGPQRISAKISQIPPASAVDIEFQQSVSKSQIKQESVTTQVTPKSSQATTNYVSIAPHTLPTHATSQTYSTQPVISSVKQEHATGDKVDQTHLSSVAPPSQSGAVKILSPASPAVSSQPVVVYGQLVHQQNVTAGSKKVVDAVALKSEPAKHQQPSTLSPGLSPHHPSLTGKLQSDVNHVTSGPSTPTDRTLPHLGVVKQEPHSPRACGHSPSPYPKVCQPSNASSPAHSINTSVMLATGITVPQYVSSMHPEQSVIMPPHSVAQTVSLSHLTQGEVRMNSPYGVHSPRGTLQQQIEIRPQRSNTPQPTPVRDMVMPSLHSQHPQDDELTHYHPVTRPSGPLHPDVLVMQPDFRMPSGPRLEQYNIHQEMLLPREVRLMMHSHMTGVTEHTDTRQTRTPDGTVKPASASKTPQTGKETPKQSEVKMAHSPHSESRLVNVNSGNQLSGLSLAQPVVVPHPVPIMHPNNAPFHDFRSMYDMRNYHPSAAQLTHQFPGTSSMGMNLQSRSITPSQPLPDGEHAHSTQPIRSKTPQITQDCKRPPSTGSDHTHHVPVNRHPGQLDTHVHVQRVQVETSQSYSSPAPVSVKQELPAHLPSSTQKQTPFITTPATTTVIGVPSGISVPHTESQPVKQEPPASQRPVDMVQLLTKYPIVWQGLLALKNDTAAVQLHFVSGNNVLAHRSLPAPEGGPPLRIAQRMRLEASQLEGVARRMMVESDYCLLLALPCGRDQEDVVNQTESLKAAFISYLQAKQAAGIINVPNPGSNQPAYVLQIFPPCEFSENHLSRLAPDLLASISNISPHLMIVIASV
ncbi:msx2-interacting protein [Protopterus annectens]|uniref:msx2-interacting protein n=1 Tax=Protopterus annectens TaxID=7888 RepID=UPI001CFAF747|nr:msx2-interacting protein [Protopterus annectens]